MGLTITNPASSLGGDCTGGLKLSPFQNMQCSRHLPKKSRHFRFIIASNNSKRRSLVREQNINSIFLTSGHLENSALSFFSFFFDNKSIPYMVMTDKADFSSVSLLASSKLFATSLGGSKSKCFMNRLHMWLACRSFLKIRASSSLKINAKTKE